MATQTLATADAILKDLYVGPIIEELNQKTWMLDKIERDADHVDHTGRRAIVPLHTNRNRGRGSLADAGTLPVPGKQSYQDAIVSIKLHYYGIEVSDAALEATKSREGSFISILDAETKGVATDMRKDMNRQAFGDGTGLLATCTSNAAGVVTLDPLTNSTPQYIGIGDLVDIVVKSTGTTTNGVLATSVTARSPSGNTVTVSPAPAGAVDTTYGFYIAGNRNNEMDGLRNISSTGRILHSINSSTAGNEFWNGNVVNSGASWAAPAVAGEAKFIQLADQIGGVGNGEVDVFLTSRGIRTRLANTYASQKRMNDAQTVKIHGGYTAIWVNEIPVVADDDSPKGYAFALSNSAFKWFEQAKPGWFEPPGSNTMFSLKTAGTGSYAAIFQAWFKWYVALGSVAPNRVGRLDFCTDDTTL